MQLWGDFKTKNSRSVDKPKKTICLLVCSSHLDLELTYAPIQLWKWQLYLSQGQRNQWFSNMLQEDPSDEDQDTIKVGYLRLLISFRFKQWLFLNAHIEDPIGNKSLSVGVDHYRDLSTQRVRIPSLQER